MAGVDPDSTVAFLLTADPDDVGGDRDNPLGRRRADARFREAVQLVDRRQREDRRQLAQLADDVTDLRRELERQAFWIKLLLVFALGTEGATALLRL